MYFPLPVSRSGIGRLLMSKDVSSEERDLLERARRLEKTALVEIYDRYSPELYRYAARLLGEAILAEECVAETFGGFLRALQAGGGPRQYLRAYLYRTAHNWVTDTYRRRRLQFVVLEPELRADQQSDPSQLALAQLDHERVRAALTHLTPDQRQVIVLRFLEDWENEEIAAALGKRVGAIKALQNRALGALKRLLDGEGRL